MLRSTSSGPTTSLGSGDVAALVRSCVRGSWTGFRTPAELHRACSLLRPSSRSVHRRLGVSPAGMGNTGLVPTTRPRHLVTETDELAAALDAAAQRWPSLRRPQLLVRLALEGHQVALQAQAERRRRRLALLEEHGGCLTGAYGPDYLHQLRAAWPA